MRYICTGINTYLSDIYKYAMENEQKTINLTISLVHSMSIKGVWNAMVNKDLYCCLAKNSIESDWSAHRTNVIMHSQFSNGAIPFGHLENLVHLFATVLTRAEKKGKYLFFLIIAMLSSSELNKFLSEEEKENMHVKVNGWYPWMISVAGKPIRLFVAHFSSI